MGIRELKRVICVLALASTLVATAVAGTKSPARTALESKNYDQVISLLAGKTDNGAEEYYLLGKAYLAKGDKASAGSAWKECNLIAADLPKSSRWNFLFPPGKKLSGAEKGKIYKAYQAESAGVLAIAKRNATKTAKGARNEAARTNIEANRLNKKADAKSEAIRDKQHVADRRAMTGQRGNPRTTGAVRTSGKSKGCGAMGLIILVIIIIIIIAVVIFGRSSGHDHDHDHLHGRGNTDALDREIMNDIDDREAMRNEVADMEAEADHMEQDAVEADQEKEEFEEAAAVLDEEPEFADDEPEEEEEPEEEPEEEEEPEPEEEPAFEDDEEEEE